jgi:hypothetical protein
MKANELFSAHVENFLRIIQDKIAEGRLIEAHDMIDFLTLTLIISLTKTA